MIRFSRPLLQATALLAIGQARPADEGALVKLRLEYEAALASHSIDPLKLHIEELQTLENKAAAAKDWATALACREARQEAVSQLAAAEKVNLLTADEEPKAKSEIRLPLALAKLSGVRFDLSAGLLRDWLAVGASAEWTLPDIPPGGYEVTLRYASSATQGGTVVAEEARYSLTAPTKITLNGPENHTIGTLRVRNGGGPFRLRAAAVSKAGLMELAEVVLTPATD